MTEHHGRRRNKPGDPTDEPMSDPLPTGEDVVGRDEDVQDTPRRYDQPVEDSELPKRRIQI
jgi:hypothetical protein